VCVHVYTDCALLTVCCSLSTEFSIYPLLSSLLLFLGRLYWSSYNRSGSRWSRST